MPSSCKGAGFYLVKMQLSDRVLPKCRKCNQKMLSFSYCFSLGLIAVIMSFLLSIFTKYLAMGLVRLQIPSLCRCADRGTKCFCLGWHGAEPGLGPLSVCLQTLDGKPLHDAVSQIWRLSTVLKSCFLFLTLSQRAAKCLALLTLCQCSLFKAKPAQRPSHSGEELWESRSDKHKDSSAALVTRAWRKPLWCHRLLFEML